MRPRGARHDGSSTARPPHAEHSTRDSPVGEARPPLWSSGRAFRSPHTENLVENGHRQTVLLFYVACRVRESFSASWRQVFLLCVDFRNSSVAGHCWHLSPCRKEAIRRHQSSAHRHGRVPMLAYRGRAPSAFRLTTSSCFWLASAPADQPVRSLENANRVLVPEQAV